MKMKNFTKTIVVLCSLMLFFAGFVYADEGGNEGSSSPKSPAINPSDPTTGDLVSSDNFLFTGSMTSQIPITVPPGTNGIQPALSIIYNSSAGNSWCGLGWDLGLGVIQRSTKTGIPKYNDDTDTFVYISQGGTQELVSIDNGEYRAKIESGFMKFLFDGSKWQVWDKSGMLYEFGSTNDSRVHAPSDSNKIFSWYLDRVTDKNNNYMAISYVKDNSPYSPYPNGETYVSNQIYVAQMDYTGNSSTGFLPQRTVSFTLEARPDILTNYEAGFFVLTAKRLQTIVTTVEIEQADIPVSRYELSYSTSDASGKSLLEKVRYYGWNKQTSAWDENTAFSAGVFDYKQDEEGLENSQDWLGQDVNATSKGFVLADFNADARIDVARTGSEEGEFGNLGEPTGFELPYNKDTGQYFIWPFVSPEGGYLEKVSVYVKTAPATGWIPSPYLTLKIKDAQSQELLAELPQINLEWFYEGWGSTVLDNPIEMVQGRDYEIHIEENVGVIGIGVDAEGPLYKIEFTSSRLEVWLSKGDSLEHSGVWKNFDESKTILKGDFNGDFKTDIARFVAVDETTGYSGLEVYLTNDTGTGIDETNSGVWTTVSAGYRGFVFGDFNGDHKTDLAKYISDEYGICNGLEVLLSTGTGFEEPQVWIDETISAGTWGFLFADFNKDGKTDISRSDAVWGNVGSPAEFERIDTNTTWDFTAVKTGQLDKISLYLKTNLEPYPGPVPILELILKDMETGVEHEMYTIYPLLYDEKWHDIGFPSGSVDIIQGREYEIQVTNVFPLISRGKDTDGPLYKVYSSPYGFQVWLSNGDGFDDTGGWTDDAINFENILLGDFNGDSMVDMAQYSSKSENDFQGLKVWCSTGETLEYTGEWTDVNAGKDGFLLADMNGDSKTDVIRTSVNGGNDGSPLYFNDIGDWLFTAPQTGYLKDFSVYIKLLDVSGPGSPPTPYITLQLRDAQTHEVLSDIGKTDLRWEQEHWLKKDLPEPLEVEKDKQYEIHIIANLGVPKKGADDEGDLMKFPVSLLPGLDVWLSTGTGLEYAGLQRPDSGNKRKYLFGDFNGDAKIDLSQYISEDENEYKGLNVWLSKEAYPDLLSEVTNALGGSTEIEYVSSVGYDNTLLPFPVRTVKSLTRKDGMTGEDGWHVYISSYVYSGGLYDPLSREFLGFREVTTVDADGNYSITQFMQKDVQIIEKDEEGNIISYVNPYKGRVYKQKHWSNTTASIIAAQDTSWAYTSPESGIYFPYVTQVDQFTYDPADSSNYKQSRVKYEYDTYGNVTKAINYGDAAIEGDEQQSEIEYMYDETKYIVSLPLHTISKDSNDVKYRESWMKYDEKGNLNRLEDWLESGNNPVNTMTYDDYGNVTSVTDAKGFTTTTTYETTYHIFPETITNPKNQTQSFVYNPDLGNIQNDTDLNAQTTHYEYDSLNRVNKVISPKDSEQYPTTEYEYNISDSPPHNTITKHRVIQGESSTLDAYTASDGLGRTILNQSQGAESDELIISGETTFNNRGLVEKAYSSYYASSEQFGVFSSPGYESPYNEYTYDSLGRVIETKYPDGSSSITTYDRWTETRTIENEHRKDYVKDAYGRIIEVREYNGDEIYRTGYTYNPAGNLVTIINNLGEKTSIAYDSLGRKIAMDDPKMGHWEYQYDNNGNLIWQKDAKAQIVTLEYDELNRMTVKRYYATGDDYPDNPDDDAQITYEYDNDTEDESNVCIGRLVRAIEGTDDKNKTKFVYDELGQIIETIKTIKDKSYTTKSTYDALGRQMSITYPDGEIFRYEYDDMGQLKAITDEDGITIYVSNITYEATGQMDTLTYGNGVITDYNYDEDTFRLTDFSTYKNSTDLQKFSYTYSETGNITSITDSVNTATQEFEYDEISRLTKAVLSDGYEYIIKYDSVGNILEKNGEMNPYDKGDWECDFEYGSYGWSAATGTWNVVIQGSNIVYTADGEAGGGPASYARSVTNREWTNPEFSIDMQTDAEQVQGIEDGDWDVGFVLFDYQDENNFYYFLIHRGKGILELSKFQDGEQYFYLGGWKTSNHDPLQMNTITVKQYFNRIQIYVNGNLEMDYWDDDPLIGGKIGVQAKMSKGYFDNLNVKVNTTHDLGNKVAYPVDTFDPMTGSGFVSNDKYRASVGRSEHVYENIYTPENLKNEGIQIDYTVQTLTPGRYMWETGWLNFNYQDPDNFYYFVLHNTYKDTRDIELSKFQDGERYELYRSSDTSSGIYNPLDIQNISIQLNMNDSNPTALDILLHVGGTEILDVTDLKPVLGGSIALESCSSIAEFDDIKITSLNNESILFKENFNAYPDYVFPELPEETENIVYDENGNITKLYNKTIRYDYDNRPKKIITDKGTDSEVITVFEYDYTGQRVFKKVKEEYKTRYIGNLYEEQIAADKDTTLTKYIYANGQRIASVVSEYEGKPKKNNPPLQTTAYYFHTDHLGGSNVITNEIGNQVQLLEYYPYGEAKRNEGTYDPTYKFTSKELDDSSGLYYYGARYYSPELGRFISPDTIVQAPYDPQSLNRYAYCRNNPVLYIDEDGHFFWIPVIVGAVIGGISAERSGGYWYQGALIGAIAGGMGAVAGEWTYNLGQTAYESLMAGGIVGGAAGGGVGGGLNAAVSGANILEGMAAGAKYGAVGGAVSAGLIYKEWFNSIASGIGGFVSGHMQGGISGARHGAWYSFGGDLLGNYLTMRGVGAEGVVPEEGSSTHERFRGENNTYVTTPSLSLKGQDSIWFTLALLGKGYSHVWHTKDERYVPSGHYYKKTDVNVPWRYEMETYFDKLHFSWNNNCTARLGIGLHHPAAYSSQRFYPIQGAYWWR